MIDSFKYLEGGGEKDSPGRLRLVFGPRVFTFLSRFGRVCKRDFSAWGLCHEAG